jgi:transcription termination factor Rho
MSTVLDRGALEDSPLADLHLIANELGIDGYRRIRKADLIDAILAKQGGEAAPQAEAEADVEAQAEVDAGASADETEEPGARRRSRGGRSRRKPADADAETETAEAEEAAAKVSDDDEDESAGRRGRRTRGGRGRAPRAEEQPAEERVAEGVVELQGNGSGFVRVNHPEPSDDDVYVSAAQIKRCELVSGDTVSGPVRPPRRSERYASLVRIDSINGKPAEEVAEGTRFEDLPAIYPTERFEIDDKDPTVKAITWLTPFGRGSRVVVTGGPRAGKTELLRRLATGLAAIEDIELTVALAGARPEELGEWTDGIAPAAASSFGASPDAQAHAVEQVVEQARRVAARGGNAVVVIDSLQYVPAQAARRILAGARNIKDGGSLTIIAGAAEPVGGETTVIALDAGLTALGRFPALDLGHSGTIRADLLVGKTGGKKIEKARAEAAA